MVWRGDTAPVVWYPAVAHWRIAFGPEEDKREGLCCFSVTSGVINSHNDSDIDTIVCKIQENEVKHSYVELSNTDRGTSLFCKQIFLNHCAPLCNLQRANPPPLSSILCFPFELFNLQLGLALQKNYNVLYMLGEMDERKNPNTVMTTNTLFLS